MARLTALSPFPPFIQHPVLCLASDERPSPPLIGSNAWNAVVRRALPAPSPEPHRNTLHQVRGHCPQISRQHLLPLLEDPEGGEAVAIERSRLHLRPHRIFAQ